MRRTGALSALAIMVAVGVAACSGGSGKATDTVLPSEAEAVSPTTSTTVSTTGTDAPTTADLYAELEAEIQRACAEALNSGQAPQPNFDERWAEVSSERKLADATRRCVEIREAENATSTTAAPTSIPEVVYADCNDAIERGDAPLYRGSPGFTDELDGNGDGIACET